MQKYNFFSILIGNSTKVALVQACKVKCPSCQRHDIPVTSDKAFRPQSGVGGHNGKGVREARYSSSHPFVACLWHADYQRIAYPTLHSLCSFMWSYWDGVPLARYDMEALSSPHIACGVTENCSLRERVKELNKNQRQHFVADLLSNGYWGEGLIGLVPESRCIL